MCWPDPQSQAEPMNTNTVNPEALTAHGPGDRAEPQRPALRRPLQGRMVAGVAAGLARYLGVEVMIVRIAFVILIIVSGAGIPLYLAGLLLIPDEGSNQSIASSLIQSVPSRSR